MPAEPTEPTEDAPGATPFAELSDVLSDLIDLCRARGRADLADRLVGRRDAVAAPFVCVVVAGDYKAGKSTLVNALVGTELCPVDDDVATVVPTVVRYAATPSAVVHSEGPDREPITAAIALEELPAYVSEAGNPSNRRRIRTVEVGIPSPLLQEGIVLVDTPGVGGLGSEYTAATLTSLSMAHAVLFVSDATQEYTGPELEFLAAAREQCPVVVPVLTKIDLFPDWVTVRARDEAWLTGAAVTDEEPELVAISAGLALRGRADTRSDLHGESRLPSLVSQLRSLGDRGRTRLAARAVTEVHAVTGQLAAPLRAELHALENPHASLAGLVAAEDTARELAGGMAEWLLILEDGISDLDDEIEREVAQRLFQVGQEAEAAIAKMDPASSWDEFEANLTRQTASEIGSASQVLVEGAGRLAQRIAEHFAEHEQAIAPTLSSLPAERGAGAPGTVDLNEMSRAPWREELFEAGWGGVEAISVIAGVLSIGLLNPLSLVVGVLMGGKSLRQARQRELEQRRQQTIDAVNRYLDDAKREAERDRQFALRRIRRELRTTYQRRADTIYRSARHSLAAARHAHEAGHGDRAVRSSEVAAGLEHLRTFDERADRFAATTTTGMQP